MDFINLTTLDFIDFRRWEILLETVYSDVSKFSFKNESRFVNSCIFNCSSSNFIWVIITDWNGIIDICNMYVYFLLKSWKGFSSLLSTVQFLFSNMNFIVFFTRCTFSQINFDRLAYSL